MNVRNILEAEVHNFNVLLFSSIKNIDILTFKNIHKLDIHLMNVEEFSSIGGSIFSMKDV